MDRAPTSQAKRWGRRSQVSQGEKMGHERARNPQGGQCFCVAGQGSVHLSQGPAGHVRSFELIPEGDRELVKAFRQKSVRIQEAFLKAHSSCAMGRKGDG